MTRYLVESQGNVSRCETPRAALFLLDAAETQGRDARLYAEVDGRRGECIAFVRGAREQMVERMRQNGHEVNA